VNHFTITFDNPPDGIPISDHEIVALLSWIQTSVCIFCWVWLSSGFWECKRWVEYEYIL